MNPLFTDDLNQGDGANGSALPRPDKDHAKPLTHTDDPAVTMIRHKIDAIYGHEPSAKQEVAKVQQTHPPRSKHQEFMYQLTTSGRSMAEIQTAWHEYYGRLSDTQKHEVWQEFYQANAKNRGHSAAAQHPASQTHAVPDLVQPHKPIVVHQEAPRQLHQSNKTAPRTVARIKKEVLKRVRTSESAQRKAHQHLQSLAFGIGLGALALVIALFGLFNELVVAPFIRPGSAEAAPIILSSDGPAPSEMPEVIVPKLNAQLPVIYGSQSLAESEVQKALEQGVYHYPTTATPGQNGNVAIFGHSSNNIFNKGKYKFAFVLLREMAPGDIFYLTYDNKVYTYKVFTKKVVTPEDTWVLTSTEGKTATAALITCDPPGSTKHRLVVWGEQISPDPAANTASAEPSPALQTQDLPGKGPSAWSRFWGTLNPFD